jgi:LPXTG-site transpeptidase (sortase) family protein
LTSSVFANLKTLRTGDTIEVIDESNKTRVFKVYSVQDIPSKNFPVDTVFGSSGQPDLVLITCSGVYQKGKNDYSSRTVVFSRLLN